METIFTLTLRTLQQNKKRAFLTIFTIILSVGMMTAVLCGGWSMLRFCKRKKPYTVEIMRIVLNSPRSSKRKLLCKERI